VGHETLVRIGAAVVGFSVLTPMAILWVLWLVRKGVGERRR